GQAEPPPAGAGEGDRRGRLSGEPGDVVEAAVDVVQRHHEAAEEPAEPAGPLPAPLDAGDAQRGELAGQVAGGEVHDAAGNGVARLVADGHVEGGGVAPHVETEA